MKIFLVGAICLAFSITAVHAQDARSGSSSTSGSTATSSPHQQQQATAGVVYAPTVNEPSIPTHTSETVKNTPDLIQGAYAPSMSSDSCLTTSQVGVSVAGIGVAGGHGVPDDVCRRLRAAEKHGQIASEMHMLGRDDAALYQMELAETDACLADGFKLEDCQRTAHDSIYPTKH